MKVSIYRIKTSRDLALARSLLNADAAVRFRRSEVRSIVVKISKRFPSRRLGKYVFLIVTSCIKIEANGKAAVFGR